MFNIQLDHKVSDSGKNMTDLEHASWGQRGVSLMQ